VGDAAVSDMNFDTYQGLASAFVQAKRDLETAQHELEVAAHVAATKERDYRLHRSLAFTRAVVQVGGRDSVAAREYEVDKEAADERYEAKLSEDLRVAALEKVRSCRAMFTAIQTLANAWREEIAFARGGGMD